MQETRQETRQDTYGASPVSTTVTVVGTGAVGSAVARRLLSAGCRVTVWNRTPGRARALVGSGAMVEASLRSAITASDLTLVTLKDYAAVHDVLDQLDGDLSGRAVVVLCTGSPGDAEATAARVEQLGARYVDAGVQTSPEDIGTDAATILYSGSTVAFEQHRETLRLLSRPRFVGTSPQAAAVWDLTLFGVWYDAQIGLLRALETGRAAGVDLDELAETAAVQLGHVVEAAPATAAEVRDGHHPRGPADLVEHLVVVRQLAETRASSRLGSGGLSDVADVIESLVARGHGSLGLSATVSSELDCCPGPGSASPRPPT